jgi:hypothetical protein
MSLNVISFLARFSWATVELRWSFWIDKINDPVED